MKLLLVEDDDQVADALARVLGHLGLGVNRASTALRAMAAFDNPEESEPDAVLLDLGLPDGDGQRLCGWIRSRTEIPIIVVTARADVDTRIRCLELGADDYLVKPYDARELVARLRAVQRRRPVGGPAVVDGGKSAELIAGRLTVNPARRDAQLDGRELTLTRKEFELLTLLARSPGVVMRRDDILRELWGSDWRRAGHSLEVHIASLRSALGVRGLVETVRGVGYRLTDG